MDLVPPARSFPAANDGHGESLTRAVNPDRMRDVFRLPMGHILSFPRVPGPPDHRRGPDRRRTDRGGRRATDRPGYAPLVLLVDGDETRQARCEAILAGLRFAVAPTRNLDEATRVMTVLRPNVIVARIADAAALRQATGADTPIVLLGDDLEPEQLIEEIRRELRSRRPIPFR